jgi:tetratricopeptide (TPR) repeat protein
LSARIPGQLALAYVESGRGREAAVEYRVIADDQSEAVELRREALAEAARLFDEAGALEPAEEAYRTYVDRYPTPLDVAVAARVRLADMAGKAGSAGTRVRWLGEIVAADVNAGTARTDYSRTRAAFATLELANSDRDRFAAIVLQAPLKKSLQAKRSALAQAVEAYQRSADYGVAEVVNAATYETASLYRRLATDLLKSERPKGLDEEAIEQYVLLLEEQAFPFEEKAIELHALNAARSRQGLFDRWIQGSFQALAELKPARYARSESGFPDQPVGSTVEATALASQGRWSDAERMLLAANAATPRDPAILELLGLVLRNEGRFADAESAYREALSVDPLRDTAMLNLAVLLDLYLDRPAEALEVYEQYQSMQAEPDAKVTQWLKEVRTRAPAVDVTAAGAP